MPMLQTPVNEVKSQSGGRKDQGAALRTSELHTPWADSAILPSTRGVGRDSLDGLYRAYSNQALLRMRGRNTSLMHLRPNQPRALQRKCDCGGSASCSDCEKKQLMQSNVQRRVLSPLNAVSRGDLAVSSPDDAYEQEAERVAKDVMHMPNLVQRKIGQLPEAGTGDASLAADLGPGRPLDSATRAFFEPRFGRDFSRVRIHTGSAAAESARSVNAQAYTIGSNVVLEDGQDYLKTRAGMRLLAHELTHVVQQRKAVQRQPKPTPLPPDTIHRIELCVDPFYYDDKGKYSWSLEPEQKCSDITIPADRKRAWKCLDSRMYWSADGKKWEWPFEAEPNCSDVKLPVSLEDFRAAYKNAPSTKFSFPPLGPGSKDERKRIDLCVNPFYYDENGKYTWSLEAQPDCSDMTIPKDRKRAWKCLTRMYWSNDGKKWTWPFEPEPNCSDLKIPMPLETFRGETAEEKKARLEAERQAAILQKNRARIIAMRKAASTDLEALAQMFTDKDITDDGTIPGRANAILDATEHRFIPGLQTGIEFGQTGFAKEFFDPWPSSENQVGHFLTAVRLGFDPDFASSLMFLAILDAWGDADIPLRLIIGHEKVADPDIFDALEVFKKQYKSTTDEDIKNFKAGDLDKIKVGTGKGNSMADLKLSHKGWIMGRWIAEGHFKTKNEIADWIRKNIGTSK